MLLHPGRLKHLAQLLQGRAGIVYLPSKTAVPMDINAGATIEAGQPIACIITPIWIKLQKIPKA